MELLLEYSGGAISEGALEELPQSFQERIAQNWAEGKPLTQGALNDAAMGLLTGAVMGGGANVPGPIRGTNQALKMIDDPVGLAVWAGQNPEGAKALDALADKDGQPSRNEWKKTGLSMVGGSVRAKLAGMMRDLNQQQKASQEAPEAAQPDERAEAGVEAPEETVTPSQEVPSILDRFETEQQERLKQRQLGDRRVSIVNHHPVTGMLEGKYVNRRFSGNRDRGCYGE